MNKHLAFIITCVSLSHFAAAQDVFSYLADFKEAPFYGFADSAGNTKTIGKYNLIMRPSEGICRVWAGQTSGSDYTNVRYGYCFINGTELVTPQYAKAEDFFEGLAQVVTGDIYKGYLHGYINKKGVEQITPHFKGAKAFSQGLAPVSTGDKQWQYIDQHGIVKIAGPFLDADVFSEGLAGVSIPHDLGSGVMSFRKGYIDLAGKMVIQPEYNYVQPFKDGLAVASVSGATATGYKSFQVLIDKTGKRLTTQEFITIYHIPSEGLYPVKISGSVGLNREKDIWGVIDRKGQLQAARFGYQPYFKEGLATFKKDSLYGYMDKNGTVIIKPEYKNALSFSEGLAAVLTNNGLWGYINKKGELIIKPAYFSASAFNEGVAVVTMGKNMLDRDKLSGAIDKTGKIVMPFERRKLGDFRNGKAIAEDNYISYYVYKNGKTCLSCDVNSLSNGRYAYAALGKNDIKGALEILKKEADKKCPLTDYLLAYILLQAPPPVRDTIQGVFLMEQAAKNGYPEAMYSAGFIYMNGLGGKKDEALAKQWLIKASKAGIPAAYTLLGTLEDKTNPVQAAAWYQQAADLGEPIAMYNLALLYRDGRGVAKNNYQFTTWLNLSAQRQYLPAKQLQATNLKK
ncbi:MAG: SEL1-like repeat protein [Niastella sp.]|nr:SEL1-like repeat protein [Niastella sp.]